MIVVDASVLIPALADDEGLGEALRARLGAEPLAAPAVVDLEVVMAWRGLCRAGMLLVRRAEAALDDLASLPMERAPHIPLLPRIWELRDNLSAYDAAYVALAETMETILLTGDERLARAPGIQCEVELLTVE